MMVSRLGCLVIGVLLLGCQESDPRPVPQAPSPRPAVQATASASVSPPASRQPHVAAKELLENIRAHLNAGELSRAKELIQKLRGESQRLDEESLATLAALETELDKREAAHAAEVRATALADAQRWLAEGDLEAALRAADSVLNAAPRDDERQAAGEVKKQIEQQRKARLRLKTAMRLLASDKRAEVRAAQEQLFAEQDAAWPLVIEASRSSEPRLAANALELLRMLNQPPRALEAMLAVLARPEQSAVWPAAIKELHKLAQGGAGERLLEMALAAKDDEIRAAALEALAGIVDPPPQTAIALLPLVYQDAPSLAAALAATLHAVQIHRQFDLAALRGFENHPTSEQLELLSGLPARLAALAEPTAGNSRAEVADNAMKLAIAARILEAKPIAGVKVSRYGGEEENGPAAAVLDGQWTSAKPENAWRYPLGGQAYLVLDLGREYTVTGVRLWNHNQPGGKHRGWKEVDIYVDPAPALLSPIATHIVAPAPPTADEFDYHNTLAVPFVRGRYVKLQPRSYWRSDSLSGLAEVQVLGY